MIAHPAVELGRLSEYAQLAENGIDLDEVIAEYQRHRPLPSVDPRADAVARLDAVSMLALVFLGYGPDPARAAWAIGRVRELIDRIGRDAR